MKSTLKWSIPIIALLTLSAIIVNSFINTPPHKFKNEQCGYCHLNYEPPLRFRDNINTLCNFCHKKDKGLSHVVGVKPSMTIPEDFHLGENGEMTCATCHNIHMDTVDQATGARSYLLRRGTVGKEFCDACHIDMAKVVEAGYSPSHSNVLETAHFGYYTTGEPYSIDRVSLACMSCHEGATASDASVTIKKGGHSFGESHRIGFNYMKAFRSKKDLRSPISLSPEIKLFGGKVGCVSCHNPFNLDKHQLSISNEESKLCMECHLK